MLVGCDRPTGRNRFRAVRTQARFEDTLVQLPKRTLELLDAAPGAKLSVIPFE